jgi:hypothetical protein
VAASVSKKASISFFIVNFIRKHHMLNVKGSTGYIGCSDFLSHSLKRACCIVAGSVSQSDTLSRLSASMYM